MAQLVGMQQKVRGFCRLSLIGSLSNGDSKENSKKAIRLDWQNNNFARASRFFVHFFPVTTRLPRETS